MKNNLFSEIFGCYYKVITEIVNNAPLSSDEIQNIIDKYGFSETSFHLLPKLEKLPFLEKRSNMYYSCLENKINILLTNIEKSWIKAISNDERFALFEDNFDNSILNEIEPLFEAETFKYYDKYADGDNFRDKNYIENFKKINDGIDNKTVLKIVYQSPKYEKVSIGHYLPLKWEFSQKDDKFRFYAIRIIDEKMFDVVCLNMARVLEVKTSNKIIDCDLDYKFNSDNFDCEEPILVEVYNERNAIERFMVEFSTYKKQSEFDNKTQTCRTKIYYRKTDETELLIKLLSFGPVLKVLAPDRFLKLLAYRIQKQMKLINS